jgi:DNA-binding response OmpR family regulator
MMGLNHRVLVCEDDPAMVRIFQFLLQKQGIGPVLTTSNGNSVLQLALRDKPNLILLDLMLPGKDGLAVLRDLKNDAQASAIPVIVVSGIESQDQVRKAMESGAADYVIKPFDSMELGERLRQFLDSLDTPSQTENTWGSPTPGLMTGGSL